MAGSVKQQQDTRPTALHCLTNFSFLRGGSHPDELVERACELEYQALAITDECSVAGIVRAYVAARDKPLRLIIGSEFNVSGLGTFIVLARNRHGYAQLCQLITTARSRSQKGTYQVALQDFTTALTECILLWRPVGADVAAAMSVLKQAFPQRLWLAYSRHYGAEDAAKYSYYQQLSKTYQVPVAAVCEVCYHQSERQPLHDVLVAIRQRQPLA